jgi:hypothetical protein
MLAHKSGAAGFFGFLIVPGQPDVYFDQACVVMTQRARICEGDYVTFEYWDKAREELPRAKFESVKIDEGSSNNERDYDDNFSY